MSDCLEITAMERLAAGAGTTVEREHVSGCARCQTEMALFTSFTAAEMTSEEAAAVRLIESRLRAAPAWRPESAGPRRHWFFARPAWGLALAGLAAVLFLALYLRNPATPVDSPVDNVRSAQMQLLTPVGDLIQAPEQLAWQPVPAALSYEVRLVDVAGEILWKARTTQTALPLTPEVRAFMTDRRTLSWQVSAFDPNGAPVASSNPEVFRVVKK